MCRADAATATVMRAASGGSDRSRVNISQMPWLMMKKVSQKPIRIFQNSRLFTVRVMPGLS